MGLVLDLISVLPIDNEPGDSTLGGLKSIGQNSVLMMELVTLVSLELVHTH